MNGHLQAEMESTPAESALAQQIEKERLIHQIALRIREPLELQACLQTTVDEVRHFLQTDRVFIYRFNQDWSGYVPVESVGEGWVSVYQQTLTDPCFGQAYAELFRRGQIRIIPDIHKANYNHCHIQYLERFQVRANLIVPIIQGQKLWGLMIAHHCQNARQWQALEVDLLQKLATQVAIAIYQAELYTQMQAELTERERVTEELKSARDEALAATRAKSDFLATMSHEIRTPMNGVIGMTELLLATQLSNEQRHYVTTIGNCGQLLLTIINDILDFSKIESGKLELVPSPFEIQTCLKEILNLFSAQVTEKGLEMTYCIGSEVPFQLIGDVTRLRQIIVNLLGNAIKFTENGKITITVTAKPVPHLDTIPEQVSSDAEFLKHYELQFIVTDTGIGIPADKIDQLFKPFSQVDSSTARQYGGTGLGLVICQRLCEMMGGRIWIESALGFGSKFYFTLIASTPSTPPVSLAGKRLLIVGQDIDCQQAYQWSTQIWGMEVYTAQSSYEAIGILTCEAPFDLILLPQLLPQMSGIQLTEAIRKRPHYEHSPILIIGSETKPGEIKDVNQLVTQQLTTPVQLEQLHAAFLKSLKHLLLVNTQTQPPLTPSHLVIPPSPKILVAEDNLVNQQVIKQWLSKLGYKADIVNNGFQVLEALKQHPYSLILMDVQMPGMDGLSATEQICQQWPGADRPKIIAMTANVMQGDRERCLAAGMDGYISKPIDVRKLAEVLKEYASSAQS